MNDICFKFKTLCNVTEELLQRNGIKLSAAFMDSLGYKVKHSINDRTLKIKFKPMTRKLEFEELTLESIRICNHIRANG